MSRFQLNCRLKTPPPALSAEQHLARIEVFNSLAVTAPQIEVDRLRYDRRHNMSGKWMPPAVGSVGVAVGVGVRASHGCRTTRKPSAVPKAQTFRFPSLITCKHS